MSYLLDANIFIEAKDRYYGLDFCPAFWDWLIASNLAGVVFSIEKVGDELAVGTDKLSTWAAQRGPGFFLKPDAKILPALATVSTWVSSQNYEQAAVSTFLQDADYYLIAHALAHGHVVVTHEIAAATAKRVKIPNVCIPLGIKVVSPFQMLRAEHANFVLGQAQAAAAVAP
jgi:hypothetical protein